MKTLYILVAKFLCEMASVGISLVLMDDCIRVLSSSFTNYYDFNHVN